MSVPFLGSKLGNPDDLRRAGSLLIRQVTGQWTSGSLAEEGKYLDFCKHQKGSLFILTAEVLEAAARLDELRTRQFTPDPTANFQDLPAAVDNLIDAITHTLNSAVTYLHAAAQLLNAAEQAASDRQTAVLASSCLGRIDRLRSQVRVLLDSIDLMSVENVFVDFAVNNIVE